MHPSTEEERRLIRNELAEVLMTVHFSNSKRYPALLSYVVEKTLAGRADELKERILGIEVFHRPSDYDTNNDTVVRVAAGEVRKRLALVYHESETEHEIHITLPSGSYIPEFFRVASADAEAAPIAEFAAASPSAPKPSSEEPDSTPVHTSAGTSKWKLSTAFVLVVLVAGFVALFLHFRAASQKTSVDLFWQPVQASPTPVIICPGALVRSADTPYGMAIAGQKDDYPFTSMATTVALADLVNLFTKDHTSYTVQPTSTTTLSDMHEHPTILIGAYNNEWTPRLQNDLRYRFATDPAARQIVDTMNPSTTWKRPASLPLREEDDYALVARFHSKLTDNTVILIAGIGKNGTEAASQFVTTPHSMDLLAQQSRDWATRNIEAVLKIKVVDGKNGAVSIEAMSVW